MQPFNLEIIDTANPYAVAFTLVQTVHEIFPAEDCSYITRLISDVKDLFAGRFEGLQQIDTQYHDLEHTLQATLCFSRLMANRHRAGVSPKMEPRDMKIGLVAMLLHDSGYIKHDGDDQGTGAKYTSCHEERSCEFCARYLSQFDWPAADIEAVQNMINCTGPMADIAAVPFKKDIEAVLGRAVATSDYVGQMSDHNYVPKLRHLFLEFEESDEYRGIAKDKRLFQSFESLFQRTPDFWEKIVKPKLSVECWDLWQFLKEPYPDGPNTYEQRIEENIKLVRDMLARNEYPQGLGQRKAV